MLKEGITGKNTTEVLESMTAISVGSGSLPVYATPAMIALMEQTAFESVKGELEQGQGSVGISTDIKHLAAVPVGSKVECETVLTKIDDRKLTFTVRVYDEVGTIGEGIHERFIISVDKFMEKASERGK